jgi:hypothetical protein
MKHEWIKDEYGDIDTWSNGSDFHNGPRCRLCGFSFCEHCDPKGYDDDTCPGYPIPENTKLNTEKHYYVFLVEDNGPEEWVNADWHEVSYVTAKALKKIGFTIKITNETEILEE